MKWPVLVEGSSFLVALKDSKAEADDRAKNVFVRVARRRTLIGPDTLTRSSQGKAARRHSMSFESSECVLLVPRLSPRS